METMEATETAVQLSLTYWRRFAAVADTFAGDIDRRQLAYAIFTVADGTLTMYATDSYRVARMSLPVGDDTPAAVFAVQARGFAKAMLAATKAAGGAKKGADVPVTVRVYSDGSVGVHVAGDMIDSPAVPVPADCVDVLRCRDIYARMFTTAAAVTSDTSPAAMHPDTFAALAAAGAAVAANSWRIVGHGDGTDATRQPVAYVAGFDRAESLTLSAVCMPVRVPARQ